MVPSQENTHTKLPELGRYQIGEVHYIDSDQMPVEFIRNREITSEHLEMDVWVQESYVWNLEKYPMFVAIRQRGGKLPVLFFKYYGCIGRKNSPAKDPILCYMMDSPEGYGYKKVFLNITLTSKDSGRERASVTTV
jgi:hypothetical protein